MQHWYENDGENYLTFENVSEQDSEDSDDERVSFVIQT